MTGMTLRFCRPSIVRVERLILRANAFCEECRIIVRRSHNGRGSPARLFEAFFHDERYSTRVIASCNLGGSPSRIS